MAKWTFFGKVLPERVPVTWLAPLEGSARQPNLGFSFTFRVAIHASQVVVDLDVTEGTPDLLTMRNAASNCLRTITDFVGYERGCYFDVEITSAVSQETDDWTVFGIEIPVLASKRTVHQINSVDAGFFRTIAQNIPAQIVLADFREAMRVPIGTGFFCYRAIEAMMQSVKVGREKDSAAWDRLREVLLIDRTVLDDIKQHADPPRHGKPSAMSDSDRARIFELTDEIIRRFFEYLTRGATALPPQDFSILRSNTGGT